MGGVIVKTVRIRTILVAIIGIALFIPGGGVLAEATPIAPPACPVTLPGREMFGNSANYGNGSLYVDLYPLGVTLITPAYGSPPEGPYSVKVGWWRSVSGQLTITGRRLDGDAPALTAEIPAGYGQSQFQVSGVNYPTAGCWQVTGRVGDATLTFVTIVLYVDTAPHAGPTPTPGASPAAG
jgi:hypothetical protein